MLGSRPFTGRLFDRVGPHIVIYPSIALFAIGLWMLTATQTATMLLYPALSSALATALWCHVYKHLRYSTHQHTVQATPQQLSLPCMIRGLPLDPLSSDCLSASQIFQMYISLLALSCYSAWAFLLSERKPQEAKAQKVSLSE